MPIVSLITPVSTSSPDVSGIGRVRKRETVALNAQSSTPARGGEIAIVGNDDAAMILVAYGTNPDAAAADENLPTTSAGFPVAAGDTSLGIFLKAGDIISIKAAA